MILRKYLLLLLIFLSAVVYAAAPSRLWNLQDADILSVINEVSQETGKNFVVDPRVSGKITLISSKPLKGNEVYPVFLSVIELLGYSAIPSGNIVKIVPNMESGELATRVANRQSPGMGDEVVIRVIPLENVTAAQMIPVLRPLLPQWSNITAYAPGNVLIILGRAANLKRILNVIQEVDKASNNHIDMIRLKHASASQVATVLTHLQTASRGSGDTQSPAVVADDRSNSVLLGGPKASRLRMRALIAELDAPSGGSAGNTEVVYLRYLEAKTLAPLLGKIAKNMMDKEVTQTAPAPADKKTSTPTNQTNIQAEPNTNAVIITAPSALMQAIKSVIAKLDIRPAQVMVEAIIAEISESNLRNIGIQWGGLISTRRGGEGDRRDGERREGDRREGGNNFPILRNGQIGLLPQTDIGAILTMLEDKNGVNILSTPSIMVLDNQKAVIEVGSEVPQQTGTYATSNAVTTVTPFNTISTRPVTLKLEVTPQINLGNAVRLKIALKNDSLKNPDNPTLNPTINTSKISDMVIVNSNDVLVLGGLMSNAVNKTINKIPILGDLPIVGHLFQQKSNKIEKKNLMVFLKPIITHTEESAMMISEMKYNYIRNIQANGPERLKGIGKYPEKNLLPPWKNKAELPTPFESYKE